MTRRPLFAVTVPLALVLSACSDEPVDEAPQPPANEATAEPAPAASASAASAFPAGEWDMVSSGEGDGLFFAAREGEPGLVHIFCPAEGALLVNVNSFRPVGSEERLSFGSGGAVLTLVADPAGDSLRGGVSGEGPVPGELRAALTGVEGVSVNYGGQSLGPLPPVPAQVAQDFDTGCND
ncbi:hypothetical protein [Aurantiacibacter luteus]|uniref:Lipoprotein n=1 Tax=Aurantiacibacter luteus TaxID=1581420 RepID=A0A0G9MZN8_9SPHN|nr:hypothetical protein [Aurantiacibacter luteus]KLE34743.1 hypothetical protein AAW00_11380 [Aurantiacibacter luteus]